MNFNITNPVLNLLWHVRWRLLGGVVMGLLIGCAVVLSIRPQYTIKMVVGPISSNGPAGMGTPAAHLRDVEERENALNNGPEALTDYDRYLELLTSPAVAEELIKTVPDVMQTMFPDRWNAKEKEWYLPWRAVPAEIVNRVRGGAPWHAPTAEDLAQRLHIMLQQRVLGATPMRELKLHHRDRGFGISLLYAMHQAADNVLRAEAARRSAAISEYIEKQMPDVNLEEHRQILSEILAAQERIRILVAVDLPYAADIVEPPSAPVQPDTPQPWPIIVLGGLVGFLATAFATTFYAAMRRRPKI